MSPCIICSNNFSSIYRILEEEKKLKQLNKDIIYIVYVRGINKFSKEHDITIFEMGCQSKYVINNSI